MFTVDIPSLQDVVKDLKKQVERLSSNSSNSTKFEHVTVSGVSIPFIIAVIIIEVVVIIEVIINTFIAMCFSIRIGS